MDGVQHQPVRWLVNAFHLMESQTLPEGARPTITDRDFMIANISAPSALSAADEEEEEDVESVEVPTVGETEDEEQEATEE